MNVKVEVHNVESVIAWLEEIRKGTGDATLLWKAVTPKIIEFANYELDPHRDIHKLWPRLNLDYLIWKIKAYKVSGMGYLTGAMQSAAGENAIRKYSPTTLLWTLNSNVSKGGKSVGDYVNRFHRGFQGRDSLGREVNQPARPLYRYTSLRINNFLKMDAKKFNDGKSHASFTYNWLKPFLEKGKS